MNQQVISTADSHTYNRTMLELKWEGCYQSY